MMDVCVHRPGLSVLLTDVGNTATEVTVTVTWKVDTEAPVITADNKDSDLECNPTAAAIEAALGSAKVNRPV